MPFTWFECAVISLPSRETEFWSKGLQLEIGIVPKERRPFGVRDPKESAPRNVAFRRWTAGTVCHQASLAS